MKFSPKILVVRQLALGDVLLTTPIIKQLYMDYSGECIIDVLTMKPEAFKNNPYVNEILTPETYLAEPKHYHKTINLDLAYENHPNMHILEAYAKYSHGSIKFIQDQKIGIYNTNHDIIKFNKLFNEIIKENYLVIHMRRDTWPSRNLNETTWKSIVDELLEKTNLKLVQVGGTHEISFDHDDRLINLLGQLTIQELKVAISNAQCYVGIDSGTLHVAASTNTPIISIFTSANHIFRMPLGRPNDAIFIPIIPDIECYGCQSRLMPPITGVICPVGDPHSPPCKELISKNQVSAAVTAAINL